MKEACKVRVEHSNHFVSITDCALILSLLSFPFFLFWMVVYLLGFKSDAVTSVPGEDSSPEYPSRFVAQFHRSHSIHFTMEIRSVFPSARDALHCPAHQRKVSIY